MIRHVVFVPVVLLSLASIAFAQAPAAPATPPSPTAPASPAPVSPPPSAAAVPETSGAPLPENFIIGPDDVLTIVFWRDQDLSGDVVVRPDGKISLPLLNEVPAAGSTPEQLRTMLMESAARYIADPTVTVVVKQINSRRVFITGQVQKPGPYPLTLPTTVVQLIAVAGGLTEFADDKNITVLRPDGNRTLSFRVNYRDVTRRKNLKQNIELQPGDTVIVP